MDFGRIAYLRSADVGYHGRDNNGSDNHSQASLVQYCDEMLTSENCLLLFGGDV